MFLGFFCHLPVLSPKLLSLGGFKLFMSNYSLELFFLGGQVLLALFVLINYYLYVLVLAFFLCHWSVLLQIVL